MDDKNEKAVDDEISAYNQRIGDLEGFYCPKCKNRGSVLVKVYEPMYGQFISARKDCECKPGRDSKLRLIKSGAGPMLLKCTLDSFRTDHEWQKRLKDKATLYPREHASSWWYLGGTVGSGKSHICAGIMQSLINAGKSCRWMDWPDESMKTQMSRWGDYDENLRPWKEAPVLIIDDFLKATKSGKGKAPREADVRMAYAIITSRNRDQDKVTIISSEHVLPDLDDIEEALACRIYERTAQRYRLEIYDDGTGDIATRKLLESMGNTILSGREEMGAIE